MEDSINLFLGSHRLLVWLVGGFIIIGPFIVMFMRDYFNPYEKAQRKDNRERKEHELKLQIQKNLKSAKENEEKIKKEQQDILERKQRIKEEEIIKYKQLRKEIETMPIYKRWRQDVFKKCGNKCQMCGINTNMEIHHDPSFYMLLKQNNINSTEKAFECKQLWNVENGEVLCKECHSKMESSENRQSLSLGNNH